MRAKIAIALAVVLGLQFGAAVPATAKGIFFDGNLLQKFCATGKPDFAVGTDFGICFGFVVAVAASSGLKRCIPDAVTPGQAMDVTKKYLDDHPESRQLPAATLVLRALRQAWPCPK